MAFFDRGSYIFRTIGGAEEGQHAFRMKGEEKESGKCQHRKEMVKMSFYQDHRTRTNRRYTRDFIFVFRAHILRMLFSPSLLPFSIYCCSFAEANNTGVLLFCFVLFIYLLFCKKTMLSSYL